MAGAALYLAHVHPIFVSGALVEVTPLTKSGRALTEGENAEILRTVERKMGSQPVVLSVIRENGLETEMPRGGWLQRLRESNSALVRWLARHGMPAGWGAPTGSAVKGGQGAAAPPSDADLVAWFKDKAQIEVARGTRLISIRVSDRRSERAHQLVQSILGEFFRQSQNARLVDSQHTRDLLQTQVARVAGEIRELEQELETYRARHNAVSLQERQNIVVERLRDLNRQVAGAKAARVAKEVELRQVQALESAGSDEWLAIRGIAELPEITDIRKQILQREAEHAMLAQRYGPRHPTLQQSKSAIAELKGSLQDAVRRAADRIQQSYRAAKAVEDAQDSALREQERIALELDRIAIPYHDLRRRLEVQLATHQKLLGELHQAAVEQGLVLRTNLQGIDVKVVEAPLVPHTPARPRRIMVWTIASSLGLLTGCGLAFGLRSFDHTVTSVDEAEAALKRPVLASVPHSRHRRLHRRPVALRAPGSLEAESFRSLRAALSLIHEQAMRCVLFTSAVPGEGKSYCALNCAVSFAQQGLRTLLVDADFRRPSLQPIFSAQNRQPNLTASLREPELMEQAIRSTPIEHLFQIGDWRHEPGSAELVAQTGLRDAIARWTQSFDRVVIDTAPLIPVSDSLYIAPHVTAICFVVQVAKTPSRVARRALRLLGDLSRRSVTGLVLNKVPSRFSTDRYYSYDYTT